MSRSGRMLPWLRRCDGVDDIVSPVQVSVNQPISVNYRRRPKDPPLLLLPPKELPEERDPPNELPPEGRDPPKELPPAFREPPNELPPAGREAPNELPLARAAPNPLPEVVPPNERVVLPVPNEPDEVEADDPNVLRLPVPNEPPPEARLLPNVVPRGAE